MNKKIKKVCVFCAASNNVNKLYLEEAFLLGEMLASNDKELLFGGGSIGLMGQVAEGALSKKGRVVGVIPEFLNNLELGHKGISEMHVVETMHNRKNKLMSESDCIVALPGGCGSSSYFCG